MVETRDIRSASDRNSHRIELSVPALETLFDRHANAHHLSSGLLAKFNETKRGISFGHEIVDDQNPFALFKEALIDGDGRHHSAGERFHVGGVDIRRINDFGFALFGKNHRHVPKKLSGNNGKSNTACLDGHNLFNVLERFDQISANSPNEGGINLVVDKGLHLQNFIIDNDAIRPNSIFEFFHKGEHSFKETILSF